MKTKMQLNLVPSYGNEHGGGWLLSPGRYIVCIWAGWVLAAIWHGVLYTILKFTSHILYRLGGKCNSALLQREYFSVLNANCITSIFFSYLEFNKEIVTVGNKMFNCTPFVTMFSLQASKYKCRSVPTLTPRTKPAYIWHSFCMIQSNARKMIPPNFTMCANTSNHILVVWFATRIVCWWTASCLLIWRRFLSL